MKKKPMTSEIKRIMDELCSDVYNRYLTASENDYANRLLTEYEEEYEGFVRW